MYRNVTRKASKSHRNFLVIDSKSIEKRRKNEENPFDRDEGHLTKCGKVFDDGTVASKNFTWL